MPAWTSGQVHAVWNKGLPLDGHDPAKVRFDEFGHIIKRVHYGLDAYETGWEIEHIRPLEKGGSSDIFNLRPRRIAAGGRGW